MQLKHRQKKNAASVIGFSFSTSTYFKKLLVQLCSFAFPISFMLKFVFRMFRHRMLGHENGEFAICIGYNIVEPARYKSNRKIDRFTIDSGYVRIRQEL